MKSSSTKFLSMAAVAICLFGTSAQSAEPKTDRMNSAWTGLLAGAEPMLTPQQTALVNNLAYQAAVTRICENFEINEGRFMAALADATAKPADKLPWSAPLKWLRSE